MLFTLRKCSFKNFSLKVQNGSSMAFLEPLFVRVSGMRSMCPLFYSVVDELQTGLGQLRHTFN